MKIRFSRRTFQRAGTAAWGTLTLGCGDDQRNAPDVRGESPGTPEPNSTRNGAGGTRSSGGADGAGGSAMGGAPQTCGDLTASNIEGPFFSENSPERNDIRSNLPGPRLRLTGTVFDTACRPISDALVDFWQADASGAYDNEGTSFRGHQLTSSNGAYSLSSIVPGRYLNGSQYRPAHIHVKVTAAGRTLTTQLYFPDDPYNDIDPFIDFSLIVDVTGTDGDITLAHFDFYVPGET